MSGYKLINKKVHDEDDKDCGDILTFLEDEFDLVSDLKSELIFYTNVYHSSADKKHLRTMIEDYIADYFSKLFEVKKEVSDSEIEKETRKVLKKFKERSTEIENSIREKVDSLFKKPITASENSKNGGTDMFKNLKEAKMFTSHLDALANEIQDLKDVSPEMRKHLAFRLDRLSDLIEKASANKEAAINKEANGVGQGAWLNDQDENRYMSTMGGTGTLQQDKDESYMAEFKGDDHMEVLKRKEPAGIQGAGSKSKQPSDNYNEAEVAKKLKAYVKNALAKV